MSPLFLTLFLIASGVFTLVCAIANLNWFFKTKEDAPATLIAVLGRGGARLVFILIGAACLGWGVYRIIEPPREIPVEFLYELAKPAGIDLTQPDALAKLETAPGVLDLKSADGNWESFHTVLAPDSPHFVDARDSAVAGPDFSKGFHLNPLKVDGMTVGGRIIYFDSDYVICDNVLFSKHPLSSAAFVMVIYDEKSSPSEGLTIVFARKGTETYRVVTR